MLQDAACVVREWRGSAVTAVDQDTTPSQTARVRKRSIHFPQAVETQPRQGYFLDDYETQPLF